jgi:hypothetical protein
MPRNDIAARVLAESLELRRQMPVLLKRIRGKWIVFRDGKVQSQHRTEDAALRAALKAYGVHGGFVIARVEPIEPRPITAGASFAPR